MPTVHERHAHYPFFNEARERISEYDTPDILSNETVRLRAKDRVATAINREEIGDRHHDSEVELLSYPLARILVSIVDEHRVTSAYARAEAEAAINKIREEEDLDIACDEFSIDVQPVEHDVIAEETAVGETWERLDESERESVIERFGSASGGAGLLQLDQPFIDVIEELESYQSSTAQDVADNWLRTNNETGTNLFTIDLDSYLTYVPDRGSEQWRLANRVLLDGRVIVDSPEVYQVLYEAIRQRVREGLPLDNIPQSMKEALQEEHSELVDEIPEDFITVDIDRVEKELFPPVIKHLIRQIQEGANLKHMERFTAASFLINIGMTDDEIIGIFGIGDNTPNFVKDQTRYQLEHIREGGGEGEAYTPPTYDTIESWGTTWQKDALEESVNHPLTYYRIKLEEHEE